MELAGGDGSDCEEEFDGKDDDDEDDEEEDNNVDEVDDDVVDDDVEDDDKCEPAVDGSDFTDDSDCACDEELLSLSGGSETQQPESIAVQTAAANILFMFIISPFAVKYYGDAFRLRNASPIIYHETMLGLGDYFLSLIAA